MFILSFISLLIVSACNMYGGDKIMRTNSLLIAYCISHLLVMSLIFGGIQIIVPKFHKAHTLVREKTSLKTTFSYSTA